MHGLSDQEHLRNYARSGCEPAFAELVRRYAGFVYSAALRIVRDRHLANDVVQGVFIAFAKNAGSLIDRPVLVGWLHQTTRNLAANVVRTDVRWRNREREASRMIERTQPEPEVPWDDLALVLDAALGALKDTDREALLLRFFARKTAREIADTLGTSEEAAQKRIGRALERLRESLAQSGIAVGSSGLTATLSANAVHAAPVALVSTLSSGVLLTKMTLTTTAIEALTMTTLQKSAMVAAIAAIGAATSFVLQHPAQVRLHQENQFLRSENDRLTQLASDHQRLSRVAAPTNQAPLFPKDEFRELLKLRGQIGLFHQQTNELARLLEESRRASAENTKLQIAEPEFLPEASWSFAGYTTPEDTVQSLMWAVREHGSDGFKTFLDGCTPEVRNELTKDPQRIGFNLANVPENDSPEGEKDAYRILRKVVVSADKVLLEVESEKDEQSEFFVMKRTQGEWKLADQL